LSYRTVAAAVQQPAHLNIKQVNNQFGLVLHSYTFPNEHINTHTHTQPPPMALRVNYITGWHSKHATHGFTWLLRDILFLYEWHASLC